MDSSKLRQVGFSLPRTSDEALSFAIHRILEWLAVRGEAKDGLKLPPDCRAGFKS
jgi:hypothetical protein